MALLLRKQSHIVVVDSRPADYRDLAPLASEHAWHLHFLTMGRAAICFSQPGGVDLWMINVDLPDMPGLDLVEMLRRRLANAPLFAVADQYRSEDERRACRGGATLYLCKDNSRSVACRPLLARFSEREPDIPRILRAGSSRRAVNDPSAPLELRL